MQRFFYDFFDGESWSQDDVGLEFESAEQACVEAFAAARSMWPELADGKRDPSACAFEIRDKNGQSLFRFDFRELLGSGFGRAPGHSPVARMLEETHRRAQRARADVHSSLENVMKALGEAQRLVARL